MQGKIKLGDTVLLGPMWNGEFQQVPIRSIHRKRLPVKEVRGGQTASFALKKVRNVPNLYSISLSLSYMSILTCAHIFAHMTVLFMLYNI